VRKVLPWAAVGEAVTYLVLMVAVVLKRGFDQPGLVPIMGPVHGTLFLVYALLVVLVSQDERWPAKRTILALLLSVVPFGGFYAERKVINEPVAA
jgi:integral membrane protein